MTEMGETGELNVGQLIRQAQTETLFWSVYNLYGFSAPRNGEEEKSVPACPAKLFELSTETGVPNFRFSAKRNY